MMLVLRDDPIIEVFDDPTSPPNWIEAIDIKNKVYQFCSDKGQRYVGKIIQPSGIFKPAKFVLQPEGPIDINNTLDLLNKAEGIEPNKRFLTLEALRIFILNTQK